MTTFKEPIMPLLLLRVGASLAITAGGVLMAVGVYTEAHHAPDQP